MSARSALRGMESPGSVGGGERTFTHAAAFYAGADEYRAAVVPFLRDGARAGDGVLVAVPPPALSMVRDALGRDAAAVTFVDMTRLGANPARIIPAIQVFLDANRDRPVRFVGEPIWPARCACELREATRHEALINLAFGGQSIAILCPYDTTGLAPSVIADAERTHPVVVRRGRAEASPAYGGPSALPASCDGPLPVPPADAEAFALTGVADLATLRRRLADRARQARFDAARIADIELAISEVLTNTLRYAGGGGTVRIWCDGERLYCQVEDDGCLDDPLAGRRIPDAGSVGGWGLVLANKLCDLVEIRTGRGGTTVRLQIGGREAAPAAA